MDQWNLLSNIVHAYDEQNLILRTQDSLKQQSSLPLKFRSKKSYTLELIGTFYAAIQPFLERLPHYQTLSPDIRRVLVQNNVRGTGAFNAMFAAREAKLFENEAHLVTCNEIYGVDYIEKLQRLAARMETNGTLIKIMLIILAFSSNCSIVTFDQSHRSAHNLLARSSLTLLQTQGTFITMMWKYLVYQYGFPEAVRRLDSLVKYYLDVLNRVNDNASAQHWEMVEAIVERIKRSSNSDT